MELLAEFMYTQAIETKLGNYHSSERHENHGDNEPATAESRPKIEVVRQKFEADW